MHRIDHITAATSLPAPEPVGPNPDGYFIGGNPAAGTPATRLRASWLNDIQENLVGVLVAAGVVPEKNNHGQLAEAIQALITAGATTDHGSLTGLGDNDHPQYSLLEGINVFTNFNTFSNQVTFNAVINASSPVAIDLITTGNRIDLDADNDTSIRCSADDRVMFEIGGVDRVALEPDGSLNLPDIDPPLANTINRNSGVKAWARIDQAGAILSSYNINSTSVPAAGIVDVFLETDFSSNNSVSAVACLEDLSPGGDIACLCSLDRIRVIMTNADDFSLIVVGDQ